MFRTFPFLKFFLVCILLLSASGATADDLIVSRALLVDRTGTLGIGDVTQAQFEEAGPLLAKGFTDAVHWLRITVRAPRDDEFELRIRPTYLDEVRLFEPDPTWPGHWIEHATGDRHANPDRPVTALGFMLASQGKTATYYLRLSTTSSSLLYARALEPAAARTADLRRQFMHVVYLCLGLAMALFALHELFILRARLTFFFLVYLVTQLSQSLALTGYLAYILPPAAWQWADPLTNILVLSTIAGGTLFYRQLFRAYGASKAGLRVLDAMLLLFVVEIALMAAGHVRDALRLNGYVVLFVGLLLVVVALQMGGGPERERRIIKRLVAAQAGALSGTMLPLLGLLEPNAEWILNIGLLHGVITSSVMYTILHFRARGLLDARKQTEMDLALAKRLLEAERRRSSEQARFMDMLTHELKTPMAAVKMVFGMPDASAGARQYALRALDDMDAVVERCRQMDQLEQGGMILRREPCRIEEVLDEVASASRAADRLAVQAGALPTVQSDRYLLRIVIGNLVDNALKYSAAGSTIQISLLQVEEQGASHVRFAIANRPGSAGLPDPERVFGKYYRAPHAHKHTGSGLGLYLVRSLTELLGGRLVYEDVDSQACFTLWIPV